MDGFDANDDAAALRSLEHRYRQGPSAPFLREARVFGERPIHLLRVAQGAGTYRDPPHDELRLGLVTRGRGINAFDLGTGRWSGEVRPGTLTIASPDAELQIRQERPLELLLCSIPGLTVREVVEPVAPLLSGSFGRLHGGPIIDGLLSSLMTELWSQAEHGDAPARLWVDGAVTTILGGLLQHARANPAAKVPRLTTRQLRIVADRLQDQLAEGVTLAQLAGAVGLSVFHFARAFKGATGMPPHRYQTQLRVDRARRLLAESDLPVTEVALAVGFASSQAFARAFRRVVGTSPTAYRRAKHG